MLDNLHKHKIDLCDEILVLNVGGYIGESTRSEIEHARLKGKIINYLYQSIIMNIEGLEQIYKDINYESEDLIDVNFDKFKDWADCDIGTKIGWCYLDDYSWWKKEKFFGDKIKSEDEWIKRNIPFRGILFTLPGNKFRIDENAVVCCYDWPIEKDNPDVFWISLDRLLKDKNIYKIYKL